MYWGNYVIDPDGVVRDWYLYYDGTGPGSGVVRDWYLYHGCAYSSSCDGGVMTGMECRLMAAGILPHEDLVWYGERDEIVLRDLVC